MNPTLRCADRRPNVRQAGVALLGMIAGLVIFFLLERGVTPRYTFVTPIDAWIPFLALSWVVYVAFFPFVIALAAYARPQAFRAFQDAVLITFVASVACFLLFPEAVPRPDIASVDNAFVRHRLERMWQLDLAVNGFPSLHVAVTCLACRMVPTCRYRVVIVLAGLAICMSTLTLKQHTLADVLGGAWLAALGAWLAERRSMRRRFA